MSITKRMFGTVSELWMVGLLILGAVATNKAAEISCGEAVTRLAACQPFLLGLTNAVAAPCCAGAHSMDQLIGSNPRQVKDLCVCLKHAASSMGVQTANAKQLPQHCSISVPVLIDPNVDCSSLGSM